MTPLNPFADDAASVSIEELTIENGTDTVAIYGSLNIDRDQKGLAQARQLKALLDQLVEALEAQPLPGKLAAAEVKIVKNPFG